MQDVPLWRLRPPRVCGKTEVGGRTKCLVTFVSFRIPHIREETLTTTSMLPRLD